MPLFKNYSYDILPALSLHTQVTARILAMTIDINTLYMCIYIYGYDLPVHTTRHISIDKMTY